MGRPLSPIERAIWWTDRGTPLNFTTLVELEGPLDPAALPAALAEVQARHPLLQVRIEATTPDAACFVPTGLPVPLTVHPPGADPKTVLEEALVRPIDWETGPLLVCELLSLDEGRHQLLLTLHHAVGDGKSGTFLARDLLTALDPDADPLPLAEPVPAAEDCIPRHRRGLSGLWILLGWLAREAWGTLVRGAPQTLPLEGKPLAPHTRRPRVLSRVLGPEETGALARLAKAQGTTVHGALSSAILLGIADFLADHGHTGDYPANFGTPVDLRRHLTPDPGEVTGFYVAMAVWGGRVSRDMDPWALARAVQGRAKADTARGTHLVTLPLLSKVFRLLGGTRRSPEDLGARWLRALPSTGGLTNVGRVDIPTDYGPLHLARLSFAVNPSALGNLPCTATTVGGWLTWHLCYQDPELSRDEAEGLWGAIGARLQKATNLTP